jgi:hypothetical protein
MDSTGNSRGLRLSSPLFKLRILLPANILHKYSALQRETVRRVLSAHAEIEIEVATHPKGHSR